MSKNFWYFDNSFLQSPALIDSSNNRIHTYSDIDNLINLVVQKIKSYNISLAVLLADYDAFSIVSYLACLRAKIPIVLLDSKLKDEILQPFLKIYEPEIILSANSNINYYRKEELLDGFIYCNESIKNANIINPDLGVLLSTSGTTGSPKLVRLSYKNIQANAESIAQYLEITNKEKPITSLPMSYSYGLSVINSHLLKGSAIVLTNKTVFFRDFWKLFNEYKCTSFAGVPYTYQMLFRINFKKIDLPTLNTMTQAGGKLNEELIKYFYEYALSKHKRFFVMYGQTEATARISFVPYEKLGEKIGSIGIPIPGGSIKLVNENEIINESNKIGEIVYYGNNVMMGYAENRRDLGKVDELKGQLKTGDLAYKDEDGFYFVTGRMKRFIKIFGLRINLDEIEKRIANDFKLPAASFGNDDLLKILIHATDKKIVLEIKKKIAELYKLNPASFEVKINNTIPVNSSGKYDYKKIETLWDNLS